MAMAAGATAVAIRPAAKTAKQNLAARHNVMREKLSSG